MESICEKKNRINEALKIRRMKQAELAEKTSITRGTISNWAHQRYQPKQKNLSLLAQALNVSELWLAGYDVPMEQPAERVRKDERLSNLLINITKLNENQLSMVESMVNELVKLSQPNP